METSFIKLFSEKLKEQLDIDSTYQPFYKAISAYVGEINPFFVELEQEKKKQEQAHIQSIVKINRRYAEHMENYEKSLKKISDKNTSEVEKFQKLKVKNSQEKHRLFKQEIANFDAELARFISESKLNIDEIEKQAAREISTYRKTILNIKLDYQQKTKDIENQFEQEQFDHHNAYQKNIETIEQKSDEINLIANEKINALRIAASLENKNNDDTYLLIKTSYNQMNVMFNKKINEIKKRYQAEIPKLDKRFENDQLPYAKALDDLKAEYELAKENSVLTYTEKLNRLNLQFDQQKEAFETKKAQIIHESNEAITLLNGKLSAFKEAIQKQKIEITKQLRDEMKNLEIENDRLKLNHKLTKELQNYDAELNKQILRTHHDIRIKQREQHARLFDLDQKHLTEIHEWRYQKALSVYEKKIDYQKIEINYTHNISIQEETLKYLAAHYGYYKELLRLTQNLELLPLEYQLQIAASIQERELNLLANDAHELLGDFSHEEYVTNHQLTLGAMGLTNQRQIDDYEFQNKSLALSQEKQLKLEKIKLSRDYKVSEQELRIELAELLKTRQISEMTHKLSVLTHEIDMKKEISSIQHIDQIQTFKNESLYEQKKRETFIQEAKFRNQLRLQHEKSERILNVHKNELNRHQLQLESVFLTLRTFDELSMKLESKLTELYHLPSHPEIFKKTIALILSLEKDIYETLQQELLKQMKEDESFYRKKTEDSTGYKYMIKHQNLMDSYALEIQKINEAKQAISVDIETLESQFFIGQNEIKRHQMTIEGLQKQLAETKDIRNPLAFNRGDKNNQAIEIKSHEKDIKKLQKLLKNVETHIDKKHREFAPFDKKMERILKKQKASEDILDQEKSNEDAFFNRYMIENQKLYFDFLSLIDRHYKNIQLYYQKLLNELYVSDSFLTNNSKQLRRHRDIFQKHTLKFQHKFLNHILNFYTDNKDTQTNLDHTFIKSTEHLIQTQKANYQNWLRDDARNTSLLALRTNQQLLAQKQKTERQMRIDDILYQKTKALDLLTIKSLELKITETITKMQNEDSLLQANLNQVRDQYETERLAERRKMEDNYQKMINNHQKERIQTEKTNVLLRESLHQKNNALLERYDLNFKKMVDNLKSKKLAIISHKEREDASSQHRNRMLSQTFREFDMKRVSDLGIKQETYTQYQHSQRKEQDRLLRKDLRLLKKSQQFKTKMLKLN